ncbi:uncharacterized protein [Zea mays]|jgi:hypothetical protein|nr:uncharacterized protein LOC109944984 [Zea mays]|eukprot:XP_020406344.1 uncharacterized protein LOC109944984 [Zea mays]
MLPAERLPWRPIPTPLLSPNASSSLARRPCLPSAPPSFCVFHLQLAPLRPPAARVQIFPRLWCSSSPAAPPLSSPSSPMGAASFGSSSPLLLCSDFARPAQLPGARPDPLLPPLGLGSSHRAPLLRALLAPLLAAESLALAVLQLHLAARPAPCCRELRPGFRLVAQLSSALYSSLPSPLRAGRLVCRGRAQFPTRPGWSRRRSRLSPFVFVEAPWLDSTQFASCSPLRRARSVLLLLRVLLRSFLFSSPPSRCCAREVLYSQRHVEFPRRALLLRAGRSF